MSVTIPSLKSETLEKRFARLAEAWRAECLLTSSIQEMAMQPAYQQIIGMGPDVVPLLLKELRERPDHWFWALRAITGENPVKPDHRGKVDRMAADWIEWGNSHALIAGGD